MESVGHNEKQENSGVVVQANQFARSTGSDCTALSAKIIYLLISRIGKESKLDETGAICVEADGEEIWSVLGIREHRSTEYLADLLRTVAKSLFFSITERTTEMYPWFFHVSFDKTQPKGHIAFKFNPMLNEYLLNQNKNFTQYNLSNIIALRSPHSVRLYNLLCSHAYSGEADIDSDDLRFIMNLTKATCGEDKCPEFWRMKQRVLDPAIAEINEKTDLCVTMDVRRQPGGVRTLHFGIQRAAQDTPICGEIEAED